MAETDVKYLWAKIERLLAESIERDELIKRIRAMTAEGKASYEDAYKFAETVSEYASEALKSVLTAESVPGGVITREFAEGTAKPLLKKDYELIADETERIQQALNSNAGIGLKAVRAVENQSRTDGLIEWLCENNESSLERLEAIDSKLENYSNSVVTSSASANAGQHSKAGLTPYIERKVVGSCCEWCQNLAGKYEYTERPDDIFRRHDNCRCMVLFDPGDGKKQDVWTKISYDSEREARIARDKAFDEDKQSRGDRTYGKKGKELEDFKKSEPKKYQMQLRADAYKETKDNYGIIATRAVNGEISLTSRHQKYLQHIEGTPQFLSASKGRGTRQSVLTISEETAQKIIWGKYGTGTLKKFNDGYNTTREYLMMDYPIGKIFQNGKYVETRRLMISYSKEGAHIVPVKEQW